jgi:hypothetical protein
MTRRPLRIACLVALAGVRQTIRWSNADAIAHTVTATSGASFDSQTIEAGDEFRWTMTRSGRVSYLCRSIRDDGDDRRPVVPALGSAARPSGGAIPSARRPTVRPWRG